MKAYGTLCSELPTEPVTEIGKILVTGASGYIGRQLVSELTGRGYKVRAMVRKYTEEYKELLPDAEIVIADALDYKSLEAALEGVHTAYYLIHSLLLGKKQFESADLQSAINFRNAAEKNNLQRIIFLGGLGDANTRLSAHLNSRFLVGKELERGKVPTTILRAAVIIGKGSVPYEIINHLVNSYKMLFIPKSIKKTRCQPIALSDAIKYLVGTLEREELTGKTYDIGGDDVMTYEMMLKIYSELIGKKRIFINSTFIPVKIYSRIVSLLTPIPSSITMCLMDSCINDVVCQNDDIRRIIRFKPMGYKEAILEAMQEKIKVHTFSGGLNLFSN